MTKLLEWISVSSTFAAMWVSLVGGYIKCPSLDYWMPIIYVSPLIFLVLFALYAIVVVLYRVFTFNDCIEAAEELKEEIEEARRELTKLGFKW